MTRLALTLFGEFRAAVRARPIGLPLKKAQALPAYLALPAGKPHAREHLATLLWGDTTDEQARNSLRQTLFALRTALGGTRRLVSEGERVWLAADGVDVDVATFERLAADGSDRALVKAGALYGGDVLEGLDVDAEGFTEWLDATRQRIRRTATTALGRLLERQAKSSALEEAVETAQRLLRIDPLQETAHRALIRLYDRQGKRAEAVHQYRKCADLLRRELGTEPEPATQAAYRALVPDRAGAPTPARRSTVDGGEGRPPFVGRAAELTGLRERLAHAASGHGGVLALFGEAGIGKTRLTEELIAATPERDVLILRGRAYESSRVLPFALWVETLAPEARMRMPELEGLGHAWARDLDPLFPGARRASARAPRNGDRLRLFEALSAFVGWLAAGRPLLVVLEDLHWADDMSLRLLAYLGRRLAGWPMLALATARPEELDGTALTGALAELGRGGLLARLSLGPLSAADSSRLARSLAPAGLSVSDLSAALDRATTVSEGNPFVVTQMMRAVSSAPAPASMALPETVRDVILGRRMIGPAVEMLEHAQRLGDSWEIVLFRPENDAWLGYARAISGRTQEGIALLWQAFDEATQLASGRYGRGLIFALLAEALLLDGRPADALRSAEQGLELTRQQGERGHEAIALHALGIVRAALDDAVQAESCFRDGLALAETLGMRPVVARIHLGRGRLERRLGRVLAGNDSLALASQMFAEMDAAAWVDVVASERRTVRASES